MRRAFPSALLPAGLLIIVRLAMAGVTAPPTDQAPTPPPTTAPSNDEAEKTPTPREEITIGEHSFRLELALNAAGWTNGLMGRTSIEPDGGMLFVYPRADVRNFWMKFCRTDIDVIFLDPRGRITAMYAMPTEPPRGDDESLLEYEMRLPRYSSRRMAQFVIELAPGWLDRLDLSVGQRLDLNYDRFRQLQREQAIRDRQRERSRG